MTPILVTAPTAWPISVLETLDHLRIESGSAEAEADGPNVGRLIAAATDLMQTWLDRGLISTTWRLDLDRFGSSRICLPYPPLNSVTFVKYYDTNNVLQTLSASTYELIQSMEPGAIQLANGASWPVTAIRVDAVQITYVAGYGQPADVPEAIRQGIFLTVAEWHEKREATGAAQTELPIGVQAIVNSYRVYRF